MESQYVLPIISSTFLLKHAIYPLCIPPLSLFSGALLAFHKLPCGPNSALTQQSDRLMHRHPHTSDVGVVFLTKLTLCVIIVPYHKPKSLESLAIPDILLNSARALVTVGISGSVHFCRHHCHCAPTPTPVLGIYMSSKSRQQDPPTNHSATLQTSNRRLFLLSVVSVLAAALVALFWRDSTANLFAFRRFFGSSSRTAAATSSVAGGTVSTPALASSSGIAEQSEVKMKTPIYFLSHGGVSFSCSLESDGIVLDATGGCLC